MSQQIVVRPQPRMWLENSVLQPYVSRYGQHLRRGRYAPSTQRVYLCCVAHFAHWLTGEQYGLHAIDEALVARFLSEHLPTCSCPYPVRRLRHELRAAITLLLKVLRADGVGVPDPASDTAVAQEMERFDKHMCDVWGLAGSTCRQRGRIVREFLFAHFGDGPITISKIGATSVRRFVLGDPGRLASLPEVLTDAEINELLQSFDQPFPSHRRAYAMTRCLIDLGLRSSEVVNLRLEDINWADGTISLIGTKGRRADLLPLPSATGSAIAAYLCEERPQTSNRAIFVRHVAPYDKPIEKGVVKRAVLSCYRRCGWTRTGVHILRHSVASRLLRTGVPMKDIADVLRHRSLDTSAIYATVDLTKLTAVALPWPGSTS